MRSHPYTLLSVLAVVAALAIATRADAKPPKGSVIAAKVVQTWQCQDTLYPHLPPQKRRTKVRYSPWSMKRHSPAFAAAQLNTWTLRHKQCQAKLDRKKWEWNWQKFPAWIIQLARCESSVNWFAEGSSSDGTFYSAFNIGRTRYDGAAHKMGVRGWHEGYGVPSPYEQAMAVIGYVRLYGDGFTGRCAGIARSHW